MKQCFDVWCPWGWPDSIFGVAGRSKSDGNTAADRNIMKCVLVNALVSPQLLLVAQTRVSQVTRLSEIHLAHGLLPCAVPSTMSQHTYTHPHTLAFLVQYLGISEASVNKQGHDGHL